MVDIPASFEGLVELVEHLCHPARDPHFHCPRRTPCRLVLPLYIQETRSAGIICSSSSPALYFYRGLNDIMVKNCYQLSYLPLSSFKGPISSPSCNAFYLVHIWEGDDQHSTPQVATTTSRDVVRTKLTKRFICCSIQSMNNNPRFKKKQPMG